MDKLIELSLKEKVNLLKKVLLLAQVAEGYTENKKILVSVKKIVSEENKLLAKSKYALVDEDRRSAVKYVTELVEILTRIAKNIKKAEERQAACNELESYIDKLTSQIISDEKLLLPPAPPAEPAFKKVLNSAASKVKQFGNMIDREFEYVKKTVSETINNTKVDNENE